MFEGPTEESFIQPPPKQQQEATQTKINNEPGFFRTLLLKLAGKTTPPQPTNESAADIPKPSEPSKPKAPSSSGPNVAT